jgi:hypothetical protein
MLGRINCGAEGDLMSMRPRITALVVGALVIGTFAQPAGASHAGAIVDCGSAGTFTLRAHDNGAGFQSPGPADVLVFEEGGTLAILEFYVNGELSFSNAETGRAHNNLEEVTCSFTSGGGVAFTAIGILTPAG